MVDEVFGFELDRLGRKVRVWESRLAYLVKVIYFFWFCCFPFFFCFGLFVSPNLDVLFEHLYYKVERFHVYSIPCSILYNFSTFLFKR